MNKKHAILALLFLLPVPSIGAYMGMIAMPDSAIGKGVFFLSKVWILAFPLIWTLKVDKQKLSWSKPVHGGLLVGLGLGLFISAFILGAYALFGRDFIDPAAMKEMAVNVGLDKKAVYLGATVYWVTVNSVLEEYVWRWFVVRKLLALFPAWGAILGSALGFTIHHIVAMQVYFDPGVTACAAAGIFIGGAIWSWCYVKYKSVWPGYLSHALVDIAVFGIGYFIIFG